MGIIWHTHTQVWWWALIKTNVIRDFKVTVHLTIIVFISSVVDYTACHDIIKVCYTFRACTQLLYYCYDCIKSYNVDRSLCVHM